jgi:hypothetical protein
LLLVTTPNRLYCNDLLMVPDQLMVASMMVVLVFMVMPVMF